MIKYYQIRIFSIITLLAFISTQTAWGNESRGVFVSARDSHMRPVEVSQARGVGDEIAAELQVGAKAIGDFSVPDNIEEMHRILHPSLEDFSENARQVLDFFTGLANQNVPNSPDQIEKDRETVAAKKEFLARGFLSWQDVIMIFSYLHDDFISMHSKPLPPDYSKRDRLYGFGIMLVHAWIKNIKPSAINSVQDATDFASVELVTLVALSHAYDFGRERMENSLAIYDDIKQSALKAIDMIVQVNSAEEKPIPKPLAPVDSDRLHRLAMSLFVPVYPPAPPGMTEEEAEASRQRTHKEVQWFVLFKDLMDNENPIPQYIKLSDGRIFITAKIMAVSIDDINFIDIEGNIIRVSWKQVDKVVDAAGKENLPKDINTQFLEEDIIRLAQEITSAYEEKIKRIYAQIFKILRQRLERFEDTNQQVDVYLKKEGEEEGKVYRGVYVEVKGVLGDAVVLKIVSGSRTNYIAKISFESIDIVVESNQPGGPQDQAIVNAVGDDVPSYALPENVSSVSRNFDDLKQLYPSLGQSLARLKPNAKILFIGPGRGYEILGIKENYAHLNLDIHSIGAENLFSDSALTESLDFHQGDINEEGLSFYPPGDFDMIIVGVAVTMYIRDKMGMVEEIYQKLKTGGVAFIDLNGTSIVKTEDDPDFTDRTHEQQSVVNFLSRPDINLYGEINIESGTVDIGDDLFMRMVSLKIDKKQDLQRLELPLRMIRYRETNNEFHTVYQISTVDTEGVIPAAAIGVEANAKGGADLLPEDIADIRSLVDQLVELRGRFFQTGFVSDDVNDPEYSRRVNTAFGEYDLALKIIKKMGVEGRMLYPCIGGDSLPAKYLPVLGIYYGATQWAEIKVRERMKNALGRSFNEKILEDPRMLEESKRDLSNEHGIDGLVSELATYRGGKRIKSVLLKRPSKYIGRASVEYLLQQLSTSCLEDGDTVILTDNEMTDTNINLLKSLGFEEVNLPQDIKDNIANSPVILESYFEPEDYGESADDGVLFCTQFYGYEKSA